jgi:hypothetical protein
MKKISLLPIIFALFLIPYLAETIKAQNQEIEISNEEYAVYSAVINKMFAGGKVTFDTQAKVKLLVIADQNITTLRAYPPENISFERLPELSEETFDDFVQKNKEIQKLKDNFKIELERTLIKKTEIEQIFKDRENGWEKFYKSFPDSGGYIGLSRVGLDKEKKQAVVYMEHNCGDLCASGYFLLLAKGKEGWEVVKGYMPWIS